MVGKFRFEPCPSCCNCPSWSDNFDRSDSTDIGADWTEVTGDAFIESGKLKLTYADSEPGLVICEHTPQGDKFSQVITVSLYNRVEDDVHKIVFAYIDEDNYYFVQFLCGATDASSTASIRRRVDGVDSVIANAAHRKDENINVTVCWDDHQVTVTDETTNVLFSTAIGIENYTPPIDMYHSGLSGGGDAAPVYFDNWYVSEGWKTNDKCPPCCCWCDKTALSARLLLTVEGLGVPGEGTGGPGLVATWFDGTACYLATDPDNTCTDWVQEDDACLWYASANAPDCSVLTVDLHAEFSCDHVAGQGLGIFTLRINGIPVTFNQDESTCDPLYLEFTSGDLGSCSMPPDPPEEQHNVLIYKVTQA
jgi:hypothetical protein